VVVERPSCLLAEVAVGDGDERGEGTHAGSLAHRGAGVESVKPRTRSPAPSTA
jgi:hypothetical protein